MNNAEEVGQQLYELYKFDDEQLRTVILAAVPSDESVLKEDVESIAEQLEGEWVQAHGRIALIEMVLEGKLAVSRGEDGDILFRRADRLHDGATDA